MWVCCELVTSPVYLYMYVEGMRKNKKNEKDVRRGFKEGEESMYVSNDPCFDDSKETENYSLIGFDSAQETTVASLFPRNLIRGIFVNSLFLSYLTRICK